MKKYNPWKLIPSWTQCRVYQITWDCKEKGKYYVGVGRYKMKGYESEGWQCRWSIGDNFDKKEDAQRLATTVNKMMVNLQVHQVIKPEDWILK